MKTIRVPGATREVGVRLAKVTAPAAVCTPAIKGLYLQDDNLEWKATEKTEPAVATDFPSFIPIRLMGETCGEPVSWRTEWLPVSGECGAPIFYSDGAVGIVGHLMVIESGSIYAPHDAGELYVWAACAGTEYGPVHISYAAAGGSK
jgi:hypothetical protein